MVKSVKVEVSVLFSEPKIPQCRISRNSSPALRSFSALQRAENSSISTDRGRRDPIPLRFSALQRAENSSMVETPRRWCRRGMVSVLFSEPKIPQSGCGRVEA